MRATDDGELFEQFIASHWAGDRQGEEHMASFYELEEMGDGEYAVHARRHGTLESKFVTCGSLDYLDGYLSGLAEADTGDDKGDLACDPDNRMELHAALARARREA